MLNKALALLLWLFLIFATSLAAQSVGMMPDDSTPAIGGYSPVSYFEAGRSEKGSPQYASLYKGNVYWFTNAGQIERFEADPEFYAPVFPDHCPYSLSLGRTVAIDPTNFLVLGDHLLLFHDSVEMETVSRRLEADGGPDKMLDSARSNLLRMEF